MAKKKHFIISYFIITGIIATLLILQLATPVDPINQTFNAVKSLKLGISNYLNIPATFDPIAGLDVTGLTPAPAISCTLTNNVHLIGTDGSDYALNTATNYFQPYFDSIVNPYNNAPVDHIDVKVYLYCAKSTLSQYNYYPYLTGGTLTVNFLARDVNGHNQQAWGYNQNVNTGEPNGSSMLIAEFNEPVSAINAIANTAGVNYVSQQTITTTGTLNFKQNLQAAQLTATYTLSGLSTYYGFQVNSPTGSSQSTQQYVTMVTPSQAASFTIDKQKSSNIVVAVGVNSYSTNEPAPIVSIYPNIAGVVQSNNPIKDFTLPATPNQPMNGGYSVWNYAIDISGLKAGTYQIGLHGQAIPNGGLFSSGQTRPWENITFIILDSGSSNNGISCTTSQLAANYMNINGACVPPVTPTPTPTPTPQPCAATNTCTPNPPATPQLPDFTSLFGQLQPYITWLSNTQNLEVVLGALVIAGIGYHIVSKKRGGNGLIIEEQ